MTARLSLSRTILVSACAILAAAHPAFATGETAASPPKSNLEILKSLLERVAQEVVELSHLRPGDTVDFRMQPAEDGWIAQQAITSGLRTAGCQVFVRPDSGRRSGYGFHLLSAALRVRYDDMYHDGFLGTRKVTRSVSASVTCDVTRWETGELVYTGSHSLESADTVAADDIATLELPPAKATHAELPSESFLDRVLEPVVIIGATGISIYLFFHVRS